MNNRFKNYGLWLAVASLVGMILNDAFSISPDNIERYVDAILTVGIAAGIINNPTKGKGFKDKPKKVGVK